MALLRNEMDFWDGFVRLNALNGSTHTGWETPRATKEHIDEFGVVIPAGEDYFRRRTGSSGYSFVALSRSSMEKIVYAFIHTSPAAEMNCERLRLELGRPLPSRRPPIPVC